MISISLRVNKTKDKTVIEFFVMNEILEFFTDSWKPFFFRIKTF